MADLDTCEHSIRQFASACQFVCSININKNGITTVSSQIMTVALDFLFKSRAEIPKCRTQTPFFSVPDELVVFDSPFTMQDVLNFNIRKLYNGPIDRSHDLVDLIVDYNGRK